MIATLAPGSTGPEFRHHLDINALLSPNLEWRKRELALEKAFSRFEQIVVVVRAPTPELVGQATAALAERLAQQKDRFRSVTQPGGGEFFARNGLLFQTPEALQRTLMPLVQAEPVIHDLATDQSLRGLVGGIEDALLGVRSGQIKLDDLTRPFTMASDTLDRRDGRTSGELFPGASRCSGIRHNPAICAALSRCSVLDYGAVGAGTCSHRSHPAGCAEIARLSRPMSG